MRLRVHVAIGMTAGALVGAADACLGWFGSRAPWPEVLAAPVFAAAWMLPPGALVGVALWLVARAAMHGARSAANVPESRVAGETDAGRFVVLAVALLASPGAWLAPRYVAFTAELQDEAFTARLSSFAWALALAAIALLALPLARVLHAAARWAVDRRAGLSRAALGGLAWLGGIALAGACVAFARTDASALGPALAAPYAGAASLVAALLSRGRPASWLARAERARAFWALAALLFVASAPLASLSSRMRAAIDASPAATRLGDLFALVTDVDHDAQSSLFGGRDCAPFDPKRGPLALDLPGNGRDEDCDGRDAPKPNPRALARAAAVPLPAELVQRHNVVLIIVDALRFDRFGRKGTRSLTPALDYLARESVVFQEAFSQSPSTRLSFPSFLSGLAPSEIAWKRRNGVVQSDGRPLFLSERMRSLGYRTGFVISGWIHLRLKDLFRGYDSVINIRSHQGEKVSPEVSGPSSTARAIEFVERGAANDDDRPFFLTLYYDGPHSPYVNHPDAGLRARTKRPRDLYDVEVQYADRQVGHFIDHLRVKPKLWPNTVVIVTADHGEEFGEHGGRFHDRTCYRESTHVPLIVRVPGLSPAVAPSRVGLTDLAPTILSLVGAPADPSLPGRNLLFSDPARYAQVPDARVSCLYFPDATPTSGLMHAVREDRWLYVRNVSRGTDEVYDTVLDPAEKRNLADDPIGRSVAERLAHAVRPPRIEARDRPTALPVKRPPKGTSATPPPR